MCTYTRHNNGQAPPRFIDAALYEQTQGAKWELGTKRMGAELNEIQPNVIYDMSKRWRLVGITVEEVQ